VSVYVAANHGPDRQTYSGMFAFGDSILFVGVFGLAAIPASGAALFFLRPVHAFWRVLSIGALVITATGLPALADQPVSPNTTTGSLLGAWSGLSPIRVFVAPLLAIVFFLSFLFAPTRSPRIALLATSAIETVIFVWVALLWFSPFQ
jgi:hypothetical protein